MNDLGDLINCITPLYNNYKQNNKLLNGTEALELMWEIGELLHRYINNHKIKPHSLFRSIYGKSETLNNVVQKSYIPREFQSRCYRIRKIFKNKIDIRQQLPNLTKFKSFREAMPFLDNKKYLLKGKQRQKLLALLNSNLLSKEIIERLPKERIGIKNPRTQRLHELENEKETFIDFYKYIYKIIKSEDIDFVCDCVKGLNSDFIKGLARNTSALAQDGLKFFELPFGESLPSQWKSYTIMVNEFIKQKDPKRLRRFRRLIPPERIVRLAEMIYALSSKENFKHLE